LGATLDYFTDRVDRGNSRRSARLDLDLKPRLPVKALPQRRIVASKLELRRTVKLEYEFVRGTRAPRRDR
jgi:hypothetical protein